MKVKLPNIYKVEIGTLVVVGVIFGFIFNAPVQVCCSVFRYAILGLLAIGIILTIKQDLKKKKYINSYIFISLILLFGLISLNITQMPQSTAAASLYTNISVVLGFFAFRYYKKFKAILRYLIPLSFMVMLYDLATLSYTINLLGDVEHFTIDRAHGLFSYSKEAGSFVIFSTLLFRNERKILTILFFSAILAGTRSAMIFVFLVFLTELFFDIKSRTTLKNILFAIFSIVVVFIFSYYYLAEHPSMLGRIEGSFNFSDSGTHWYRFYIWNLYLNGFNDYSFINMLFGNLQYLQNHFGNGAENAYLTVLSNGGLVLFLMVYFPMSLFAILTIKNIRLFYPFVLLIGIFMFGRQGLEWAGGIVLWAYIFHILHSKYFIDLINKLIRRDKILIGAKL